MPLRSRKILFYLLIIPIVLIGGLVLYELYFHKPLEVKNNLIQPDIVFRAHTNELWTIAFNHSDSLIASGGVDSTVRIWRKDNGAIRYTLKHPQGITALKFSPSDDYLITSSYDGIIRIWDWKAEKVVRVLKGSNETIWTIDISQDRRLVASGGEDKTVRIWDVATGQLLQSIKAHDRNIWKVRFTPEGNWVISSSFDTNIKVWEVSTGKLIQTLAGHKEAVVGLDVNQEGTLLASGSDDETIKLWDLATGKLIRTMDAGNHVYAVAFSPDGKWLLCGNRDKDNIGEIIQNFFGESESNKGISMELWDVASGRLLQTLSEHRNEVMDVKFSHNGQWAGSVSTDKTARLWKIQVLNSEFEVWEGG